MATTLTRASTYNQYFTASQSVILPDATTLTSQFPFRIFNNSAGVVTVVSNTGTTIQAMAASTVMDVICTNTSTKGGTWQTIYLNQGITAGGAIVDTGTFLSPQSVTTNITVPTDVRARIYVVGNGGPVAAGTISNGNTSTQELFIVGTDDTNYVELSNAANLILSGPVALKNGTILYLQWVNIMTSWYEVSRNEL